jgi:uracil phosphoribosyltransferase
MSGIFEAQHPLIAHHLSELRDKNTDPAEFRRLVQRLAVLLAYEATKDLEVDQTRVQTPLATTAGQKLRQRIGLIPILRAGLGMVDPVLNLIPGSEVWHLGVYRDEATATPVEYYKRFQQTSPVDVALVLDPMLATGGSAVAALATLKEWGVPQVKVLAVIAAREGIDEVFAQFPNTQIYVCAIDPELNAKKYIVPGLGDAGDRIFNTPPAG